MKPFPDTAERLSVKVTAFSPSYTVGVHDMTVGHLVVTGLIVRGREHCFTFAGSTPALVDDDHDRQPAVKKQTREKACRTPTPKTSNYDFSLSGLQL